MSEDISRLRQELDGIDRELLALFEKRMEVSRQVAAYKLARGLPVLDALREEQVLLSREAMVSDPALGPAVRALFDEVMRLSRQEQERVMKRGTGV